MGFTDHPYAKEIQGAINSPAFVEFQKQPFSMKRWFDFLESQGVKSYRNMYTEIWSQLYPETDLASYAADVKNQLVEVILNTDLVGRPGSLEREMQIMSLYHEKVYKPSEKKFCVA